MRVALTLGVLFYLQPIRQHFVNYVHCVDVRMKEKLKSIRNERHREWIKTEVHTQCNL